MVLQKCSFTISILSTSGRWFIGWKCSSNVSIPFTFTILLPTILIPSSPTGGSSDGPALQPYPYSPPQHVLSGGGDNSGGGENTSHTTQAPSRTKKQNEWTHVDEKNLILLNFIILLFFI
jgi:hypothetical protein